MNIKTKIAGALATGALLASAALPAGVFAATNVTIGGNGAGSSNGVAVIKVVKSKVKQKNTTVVATGVTSIQNTGGNKTSFNVDGTNSITTGNNRTTTTVDVSGGTNVNAAENCCCDGSGNGDTTVDISGNGALSHNGVLVLDVCKSKVSQSNTTVVVTDVTSVQNTGGNSSSFNVGGDNTIDTGNNTTTTTVTVTGSTNVNGPAI
jgi:hypothetical protein